MRHITITLLGYGEIKGETFPDDDFVDQGILYPKNACNGCICSYPNVFFWGKHSMSMYFSCICYSVFALLLSSELLDTFLFYLYFAGYGYTGQYNNNPHQSKPELPPHYSQFN